MPRRHSHRYTLHGGRDLLSLLSAAVLLIFVFAASGCSFNYQSEDSREESDRPDYILYNTDYTVSRAGNDRITFSAQKAVFYTARSKVYLDGVTFVQQDEEGTVLTEGSCARCEIETNTNDAVLSGNVQLTSYSEKTSISAEILYWEHKTSRLSSDPEAVVTIQYRDGSTISGKDFHGDFDLRLFEFAEVTEGVVRYE